jgi:hypothetical protein
MNSKRRRAKEKRRRKKQRQANQFETVLADLITKLPAAQPPGEDYFLLELGHVDDPADLSWNRNATAIGTWDQVRNALPGALAQLVPIRGELKLSLIQGEENIGAKLTEISQAEHAYQSEKRAIPLN